MLCSGKQFDSSLSDLISFRLSMNLSNMIDNTDKMKWKIDEVWKKNKISLIKIIKLHLPFNSELIISNNFLRRLIIIIHGDE